MSGGDESRQDALVGSHVGLAEGKLGRGRGILCGVLGGLGWLVWPCLLWGQEGEPVLPKAERVVPLPAVPAPKDFSGFGDRVIDRTEELPNPNLPPAYVAPKPPERVPLPGNMSAGGMSLGSGSGMGSMPLVPGGVGNSQSGPVGRLGLPQQDPAAWMQPERPTWQDPTKTPAAVSQWMQQLSPSVPAQGISFAREMPAPAEPWTFITGDSKRQLEEMAHAPPPAMSGQARPAALCREDFAPTPFPSHSWNPLADLNTYYAKTAIPTQRPWVEWWRPFYAPGVFAPSIPVFSDVNPLTPQFILAGDYRTAIGIHHDNNVPVENWAHRLNLEADMRFTSTERFHVGMGPLDNGNQFTRLDFSQDVFFDTRLDAQPNTAFFEGDLGAMLGGIRGVDAPFDLPVSAGLVPLLYQNGIWMEDAILGAACAFPWRHSRALNWSNFDATFFAGFSNITSPAFENDNGAAQVFGTAWFIEAYEGYIEADYAYLNDIEALRRDYHNFSVGYTRRYFHRISNSVRFLLNLGQEGPRVARTADGGILFFENSWIGSQPSTFVPYFNSFLGYGSPQSVARAAGSGGILRNVGLAFETDGLTGYPTLDASGSNAYGGAVGLNVLTSDFRRQFVIEAAMQDTYGDPLLSRATGAEYSVGTRFQQSLNNWSLIRLDFMSGWREQAPDMFGSRIEYRWKF